VPFVRDYRHLSLLAVFFESQKAFEPRQTHDESQQPDQYPKGPFWRLADHEALSWAARQSK
jgi:hypothetical protein